MTYIPRNFAEEQKEAGQHAKQLTAICEEFHITLDPIDWQTSGLWAWVSVNAIKISDLRDLSKQDNASILRQVQIKLLEQAALKIAHARPDMKALMWTPVEVVQPQEFLGLWIVTLETDERVPIAEYIRNGKRVYEHFTLDVHDQDALLKLFGPANAGEYAPGDSVTIDEHERRCTGEVVYILPPGKAFTNRKFPTRGRHTIAGKVFTNDLSSRYLVDCQDGFPHVVYQWQIINTVTEGTGTDGK